PDRVGQERHEHVVGGRAILLPHHIEPRQIRGARDVDAFGRSLPARTALLQRGIVLEGELDGISVSGPVSACANTGARWHRPATATTVHTHRQQVARRSRRSCIKSSPRVVERLTSRPRWPSSSCLVYFRSPSTKPS